LSTVCKQKFTVWEDVCTALFTPTPVPVQTALNESAIYYVYAWLTEEFNNEVQEAAEIWGKYVLAGEWTGLESVLLELGNILSSVCFREFMKIYLFCFYSLRT
jgi:hypothetical protein